jgi:hypothetical protein
MGVGLAATHVWTLAVVGLGAAHARLTLFGLLRHRSQGYRATARAPQGNLGGAPHVIASRISRAVFAVI